MPFPDVCTCDACRWSARQNDDASLRILYDESDDYIEPPYDDTDYDDTDYDDTDDYAESSLLIRSHSYKPQPTFFGRGPRFMGFELETTVPNRALDRSAERVQRSLGDLGYLKEDGSITHGFEIVTHPMSYRYATRSFPWADMADWRDAGIKPDRSTGLHVHISRSAFDSMSHAYRWVKFFYRSQRQIEQLARRRSPEWACFSQDHRDAVVSHIQPVESQKPYVRNGRTRYPYSDRYVAVNTQNRDTFEVRVFASTDKPQELQAALGLIDSSVRYTGDLTAAKILKDKGWEWSQYAAYVNANDYVPLSREMRKLCV